MLLSQAKTSPLTASLFQSQDIFLSGSDFGEAQYLAREIALLALMTLSLWSRATAVTLKPDAGVSTELS
jgi:hypothetical protein